MASIRRENEDLRDQIATPEEKIKALEIALLIPQKGPLQM
jgi:hypothetical protein